MNRTITKKRVGRRKKEERERMRGKKRRRRGKELPGLTVGLYPV